MARLDAPLSYREASEAERREVSAGCGPEGASAVVPDVVFGADFREACSIHDWEYTEGEDIRSVIDARFARNLRLAAKRSPWYLRPFALYAAGWYARLIEAVGGAFYGND